MADSRMSRRRRRVRPTETIGGPGVSVWYGYVDQNEQHPDLSSHWRRYRTYSDLLANVSVIAAGVRYYANLVGASTWSFAPSEADASGEYAERAEQALTADPATPWHRIVRRAAMYRLYGFSVQEWTARRHDDGYMTFADISPRAQSTIERWDVDPHGRVMGVWQRQRQQHTLHEVYIPREKVLYLVEGTLNDSPEGLGLFRHLVAPGRRLQRYEQLEGIGYEKDLRGAMLIRIPRAIMDQMVSAGEMAADERDRIVREFENFAKQHIRNPELGILMDSQTYRSEDDAGRPSNIPHWDVELLRGGSPAFEASSAAIERVNREIARILGIEHLLLGSGSAGSFALAKDKSANFFLVIKNVLAELKEAVEHDLLKPLWALNGWGDELMPKCATELVRLQDVEEITVALRDMATAGAVLEPNDPAIGELYDLMGLTRPPERDESMMMDMSGMMNDNVLVPGSGQGRGRGSMT